MWDLRKEGPLLLSLRWGDPPISATFDHVPVLAEPVLAGFTALQGLLDQCSEGNCEGLRLRVGGDLRNQKRQRKPPP